MISRNFFIIYLLFSFCLMSRIYCDDAALDFYKLLEETKNASDYKKDSIVEKFVETTFENTNFPLVSGNKVIFVYYGTAESVKVSGDMIGWDEKKKLKRVAGTRLFYTEMEFEKDARFDYKIIVDGKWVTDPLNRRVISSNYGENSYFGMSEYTKQYFDDYKVTQKGVVSEKELANDRKIKVYKPYGYSSECKYKVVYVADGYDYLSYSGIIGKLDYLIEQEMISPVLFVFIETKNDSEDFLLSDEYYKYFTENVIPFVEGEYCAVKGMHGRFLLANGLGAVEGFYMINKNPMLFDGVISQSGALLFTYQKKVKYGNYYIKGKNFLSSLKKKDLPVRIFLISGVYENNVDGHYNYYKGNKKFYETMLDNKSVRQLSLRLHNQGHGWGLWSDTITEGLLWLLEY